MWPCCPWRPGYTYPPWGSNSKKRCINPVILRTWFYQVTVGFGNLVVNGCDWSPHPVTPTSQMRNTRIGTWKYRNCNVSTIFSLLIHSFVCIRYPLICVNHSKYYYTSYLCTGTYWTTLCPEVEPRLFIFRATKEREK